MLIRVQRVILKSLNALLKLDFSCKGDLGYAHKRCAESWFKVMGSMHVSQKAPLLSFSNEQMMDARLLVLILRFVHGYFAMCDQRVIFF